MQIELVVSPVLYGCRSLQADHTTVAVDILRASSSICAAFSAGATEIVPLNTTEHLDVYGHQGFVIAAERNGKKLSGATCGNSPTEYQQLNLDGKRLAYSTTNGTVAILTAAKSQLLLVGAFANISALSSCIVKRGTQRLVVLCSGWKGDMSIEDTLFGGALIEKILQLDSHVELVNDAAMMASDLWNSAKDDLYAYCSKATHVHRLQRLDYDRDIRWALTPDTCPVLPYFDQDTESLKLI